MEVKEFMNNYVAWLGESYEGDIPYTLYDIVCRVPSKSLNHNKVTVSKSYLELLTNLFHQIEYITIEKACLAILISRINKTFKGDYITFRNTGAVSYLPEGREHKVNPDGTWKRDGRQEMKIGKFLKQYLPKVSDSVIENLTNKIKAKVLKTDEDGNPIVEIKLVQGEDIRYWYLDDNYHPGNNGTLDNSCMKHESCQDYFDIYVDNAKMLVAIKENKLIGRALVWETNKGTFMDRAYGTDVTQQMLLDYAKERGWLTKTHQDNEPDNAPAMEVYIGTTYSKYPYMDTFRYYDVEDGVLTNVCSYVEMYELDSTSGEYTVINAGNWSERHECFIPEDESVYLEYLDDYEYIDNCSMCAHDGRFYLNEDIVNILGSSVYVDNIDAYCYDRDIVEIDGEYYYLDDVTYCDYSEQYYPNEYYSFTYIGDYCVLDKYVDDFCEEHGYYFNPETRQYEEVQNA